MLVDAADRGHLARGAGEEDLGRPVQLVGHDDPLHHLDAAVPGQAHDRAPGDAVEKTVGYRRVQRVVAEDEEDVGAGRLGDAPAPVQHQRVLEPVPLGGVLGQGADHVKPRRLGLHRGGLGRRAAPFGRLQPDALHARLGREIRRPRPGGDGQMDPGRLRRDAHHLAAAPGQGPDVAVDDGIGRAHLVAGGVDLGGAVRQLKA